MSRHGSRPRHEVRELEVTALAAGGDGVARDADGRVTFVPRTAPGDRVRAQLIHATKSFARAVLVEVITPGATRTEPVCPHFTAGCGGCQWQHVTRDGQLAAKQAVVASALRRLDLVVHPIAAPAPALGWRRRARFHVAGGKLGLYVEASHRVLPIDHCPQLDPRLDSALGQVAAWTPPDGELALVVGHRGDVAVGVGRAWPAAAKLVGKAAIRGVVAGDARFGEPEIELEPGLWSGPWDFAQASAAGNAALIACARGAVGAGAGRLLELYAGSGNLTRALIEDGWDVTATDATTPSRPTTARHVVGKVGDVLAQVDGDFDVIVLDPPRTGAADAIDGIVRLGPRRIVYVSCDPATLARDLGRFVEAGYRATDAWPLDLMPQTAHVEVVVALDRG